jgi:cell division transport system permease protein
MRHFFFKQLSENLRARPIITVLVVVLCAAGLASAGALQSEFARAMGWWEDRFTEPLFEVYLDNSVTEEQALAVRERLNALDQVQHVEYVSAEDARREAENYLGSIAFSILPENPLPASLRVAIAPDYRNPFHIRRLTDSLIATDGIAEIMSADQQITMYAHGRRIISDYSTALLIASFGWTVLWLFIGVYLMLRTRSAESKVWRYLGARPGWMRWPPVAEGFILGLCATGLGWAFFRIVSRVASAAEIMAPLGAVTTSQLAALAAILPLAGTLAGWLAYRVRYRGGRYL